MKKNIKHLEPKAPFNARRGWHHEQHAHAEMLVRDGYKAVACHGEAHNNPHIDNCMLCLNHIWGWRAVPESDSE